MYWKYEMSMGETQQTEHNWESLKKKWKVGGLGGMNQSEEKKIAGVYTHAEEILYKFGSFHQKKWICFLTNVIIFYFYEHS